MINRQMILECRKPGKIYAPVMMKDDVTHIAIEKKDFCDLLAMFPRAKCQWVFTGKYANGRVIDLA